MIRDASVPKENPGKDSFSPFDLCTMLSESEDRIVNHPKDIKGVSPLRRAVTEDGRAVTEIRGL